MFDSTLFIPCFAAVFFFFFLLEYYAAVESRILTNMLHISREHRHAVYCFFFFFFLYLLLFGHCFLFLVLEYTAQEQLQEQGKQ